MGPTISFKGLEQRRLLPCCTRPSRSTTWTTRAAGTRSTATTRSCEKFIVDCLDYWVERDARRRLPLRRGLGPRTAARTARRWSIPPVVWHIELSEELADTKVIAEAWDAGGLYQIGYFPGYRWAEWNGRFRDDVRRFVQRRPGPRRRRSRRGSPGSMDMYEGGGQLPDQQRQLHHRPRRLHAQRPRLLQREAQRGERRGQPRRHRRQPELELRRRGRRPTTRRSTRSATGRSRTSPRSCFALAGRADVRRRRRGRPHAARQQQRLLPGQRAPLVRLDAGRGERRPVPVLQADDRLPPAPPEPAPAARSSPAATTRAACRTSAGTAASSTSPSWDDAGSRVLAFTLARRRSRSSRTCT